MQGNPCLKGQGCFEKRKEKEVMNMTRQRPDQVAFAVDTCASALGVDEFTLLSRIQMGEINAVRASSGEIKIPESELERLAPASRRGAAQETTALPRLSDRS